MAGPPVEVQVRVNTGGSVAGSVSNWKVSSPGIVTCPVGGKECHTTMLFINLISRIYTSYNYTIYTKLRFLRDLYVQFTKFVDSDRECTSFHTVICIHVTKSVISHIPY